MTATAFWIMAPGQGALRTEVLPQPAAGEARVRALVSGISRGTESLVFRGGVPPDLAAEMRCPFQVGDFPGPVKYGYSLVGVVEAGSAALLGRRVFCMHPHQDRLIVPETALLPVPDAVPTDRAVLAANMETAVNILWDARLLPGMRVAVVGAGVVGCLAAWLAGRLPGAAVTLIDTDPGRARVAAALGVGFALPDAAPGDGDVVIHASGTGAGLATALSLAGVEATVVEASWYGDHPVTVPLGGAFHPRRLRLISSQVGRVAPAMRARRSHRDRLSLALSLLSEPRLDALLDGAIAFSDLPAAMAALARAPGVLCRLVRYDQP